MKRVRRRRASRGARASSAFTLIELLLVVTIIVVLCGILYATIHYALKTSATVLCMANLHQAHAAFVMYASNNGGFLPPRFQVTPVGGIRYWGPRWFDAVYPYAPDPSVWYCPAIASSNRMTNSSPDAPVVLERNPDGSTNTLPTGGSSYCMERYLPPSVGPALWETGWNGLQPAYKWVYSTDPDVVVMIPYDVEKPIAWADAASRGTERALLHEISTSSLHAKFHVLYRYDNNGTWRDAAQELSTAYIFVWRHPCSGKGPGATADTKGMGQNVLFFDGRVGTFAYQEMRDRDWSKL